MFSIYRLTLCTGKSYIGMTSKLVQLRANEHFQESRRSQATKWLRALRKYASSVDDIQVEVLEACNSLEEAARTERSLIEVFQTISKGYNTHEGGRGGRTRTVEQLEELSRYIRCNPMVTTQEQRERLNQSRARFRASAQYREWLESNKTKMRDRFTGKNNPNFGKAMPPDRKRKMVATKSAKYIENPDKFLNKCYILRSPDGLEASFLGQRALFEHLKSIGLGEWSFRGKYDGTPVTTGKCRGWSVRLVLGNKKGM